MLDIKTVTVVPADRMIAINGEAYQSDAFEFLPPVPEVAIAHMDGPPARGLVLHAIQWWGDHGQIEVSFGPARGFTDRAIVEPYVPQWLSARAEQLDTLAQYAERQVALLDSQLKQLDAAVKALDGDIEQHADNPDVAQSTKDHLLSHKGTVEDHILAIGEQREGAHRRAQEARQRAAAAASDLQAHESPKE